MLSKNNSYIKNNEKWIDNINKDWNKITENQPETNTMLITTEQVDKIRKYLNYSFVEVGPSDVSLRLLIKILNHNNHLTTITITIMDIVEI